MKLKNKKFSQDQRLALLQGCVESGLSVREYAALKNVGLSTLNKWASQIGISLAKKQNIDNSLAKTILPDPDDMPSADTKSQNNSKEAFSFINLTDHIKDATPGFVPSPPPCGLEILMPNGVVLKVGQVPFGALWPEVVKFFRTPA